MNKFLLLIVISLSCSFVLGYSQKANIDTLIEIGYNFHCRDFANRIPGGKYGAFEKTDYFLLFSKNDTIYISKHESYDEFTGDSFLTHRVAFKPIEVSNFDKELLSPDKLLTMKGETISPFMYIWKNRSGEESIQERKTSHPCVAFMTIHLGSSFFVKEIDLDSLLEYDLIHPEKQIYIYKNASFDHNQTLLSVRLYELIKLIADRVSEKIDDIEQ